MGKFWRFGVDGMSAMECIAKRNNVLVNDYSNCASAKSDVNFVREGGMQIMGDDRMNRGDGPHGRG
jgi:hypothetical protein